MFLQIESILLDWMETIKTSVQHKCRVLDANICD